MWVKKDHKEPEKLLLFLSFADKSQEQAGQESTLYAKVILNKIQLKKATTNKEAETALLKQRILSVDNTLVHLSQLK